MVKRISTVSEAMDFLHNTEKQNRDSIKHVILDCSATLGMVVFYLPISSKKYWRQRFRNWIVCSQIESIEFSEIYPGIYVICNYVWDG